MSKRIRVGIVGAGDITRKRHLPGLRGISGVEVLGVVNSTPESTKKVAGEFGIPRTYAGWQELVADPDLDAVVIGAGPNLHSVVTVAALEAGKHVLCESRMARDLTEARTMLQAAQEHPELTAQLVPSPYGLKIGPAMDHLIRSHYLGDLREVVVTGADDMFWDYTQPFHWRQNEEISGKNILRLGIMQETLMRWTPLPVQVFAQTEVFEPTRPVPAENHYASTTIPDSVQILAELQNGARVLYHFSGVILFGPGLQIHLYGSRGTIRVHFHNDQELVYHGRSGDSELQLLDLPIDDQGRWQVEEDFIAAVRGERPVTLTSFETGVQYMEFLEAVHQSAKENAPVALPLE